ncbi:Uncharacterised protein [Mycobacteroides abscessus subsp. abscessus]|nr:Uncharacterised protein [Mycobacteroides abscessus subsp. abscessus]
MNVSTLTHRAQRLAPLSEARAPRRREADGSEVRGSRVGWVRLHRARPQPPEKCPNSLVPERLRERGRPQVAERFNRTINILEVLPEDQAVDYVINAYRKEAGVESFEDDVRAEVRSRSRDQATVFPCLSAVRQPGGAIVNDGFLAVSVTPGDRPRLALNQGRVEWDAVGVVVAVVVGVIEDDRGVV